MADTPRQRRPRPPSTGKAARATTAKGSARKARPADESTDTEETEQPEQEPGEETLDGDVAAFGSEDEQEEEVPADRALVPAAPQGLAQADLLQRYMAEVSRHPLLTREEETRLAREYVRTQDPKLAYRLVTANLRLVVKIAWEYRRAAFNLLDLVQEGNVGLMQGVRKFDPERGVKLSTYAAWWIRAYIIRYLMDNWRIVKLGTTQAQRKIFFNLRKEKERLAAQGFEPEPRLLAERLQVSEEDVRDMEKRLGNDELSIDTPIGDESSSTYGDRLAAGGEAVDDRLADEELGAVFRKHLAEFAKTLKDKEQYIFEHRLTSDEPMTLQDVGNHFGISRERARQIEARLTGKLRDYMKERLPDFEELSLEPPDE